MVKAIEAAGLPVVHMCTVTPISMTVGANRIVPTIAIPHPLGNPELDKDEEYALRKSLVKKALEALDDNEKYGMILRAKGIVEAEAGGEWIHFDYIPGDVDVRRGPADVIGRLSVIGTEINQDAIKTLFTK